MAGEQGWPGILGAVDSAGSAANVAPDALVLHSRGRNGLRRPDGAGIMTAPCLAPGPNDPSCGYDSETGGCVNWSCRYVDAGDAEGPRSLHRSPRAVDLPLGGPSGHPADSVARLAALAEAGQGARTRIDAGVILDVIARGLRFIETEMRQG